LLVVEAAASSFELRASSFEPEAVSDEAVVGGGVVLVLALDGICGLAARSS
jgi:hypothetical protein